MNKNVLNKLSKIESKVELAEVKVDLALVDDLNKIINDYKVVNNNYQTTFKEFADIDKRFTALKVKAREFSSLDKKVYSQSQQIIDKIQQQAKDLGVDASGIKGVKELYQLMDDSSRSYKTYDAIEKYNN